MRSLTGVWASKPGVSYLSECGPWYRGWKTTALWIIQHAIDEVPMGYSFSQSAPERGLPTRRSLWEGTAAMQDVIPAKKKISSSMGHNSCPEPLLLHGLFTGYSTDICTKTILCAAAGQPASLHCSLQLQNHCSISWSTSFPLPLTSVPAGLFLSYILPLSCCTTVSALS